MMAPRLSALDTFLLVIDVQDKLLVKMPDPGSLVRDVAFLMDVAKLLQVPVTATEQYPKGAGADHCRTGARRLPPNVAQKSAFSGCALLPGILPGLQDSGRTNIVLTGMETYVCIMHTAFDLLAAGMTVFVPVDAGGLSLSHRSRRGACDELEKAGRRFDHDGSDGLLEMAPAAAEAC